MEELCELHVADVSLKMLPEVKFDEVRVKVEWDVLVHRRELNHIFKLIWKNNHT